MHREQHNYIYPRITCWFANTRPKELCLVARARNPKFREQCDFEHIARYPGHSDLNFRAFHLSYRKSLPNLPRSMEIMMPLSLSVNACPLPTHPLYIYITIPGLFCISIIPILSACAVFRLSIHILLACTYRPRVFYYATLYILKYRARGARLRIFTLCVYIVSVLLWTINHTALCAVSSLSIRMIVLHVKYLRIWVILP